jgi:hypothetical protein
MHSGCFCYRSNNVWFWKEQGLVSFAEMKCQKCKHFGAHNTPLPREYSAEVSVNQKQLTDSSSLQSIPGIVQHRAKY